MRYLKPLKPNAKNLSRGCLNCGFLRFRVLMNMQLYQCFGGHHVTRNGKIFYWPENEEEKPKTLQYVENKARKHPRSDFRLHFVMPLYDAEYQRQGKNNWVLVRKGRGFA
jgi:hypothetical protein